MKPTKTPQQKKELSYKKDRRNVFGENDKASRKAIPKRKKDVIKSYRKSINQTISKVKTLTNEDLELLNAQVKEVKKKDWKKSPDKPLGEYLKSKGKLKFNSKSFNLNFLKLKGLFNSRR